MPAKSAKQRRAAGLALAIKGGKAKGRKGGPAAQMAKSMSKTSLKHFASKPRKKK